eukprot:m.175612 g.175612  ORF g.175612 m.175612 type:complete len:807 (+) comp53323_c0_seq2:80-2500(+)
MSAPGLPSKEAGIFKRLIKFFDDRKYKDVLRMARQIMSNSACQNHPETLCLKGIALINLDQKAEGQEAVKRGLALGIKSALCWHMFGVMHRHERTYVEAIKAYSQAVKLDKNVGQYYKEMSNMYLLLRDFEGYYQTRKKLLQERPNIVSNWCEFAFAAYVRKDYDETDAILTNFTKINKSDDVHALGELLSFHVVVLTEKAVASQNTDHFQAAFDFLTKHNAQIQDTAFRLESTAFLSAQLADRERAEAAHRALLAFNAENVDYFKRYHKLVFPDASADEARILAFYDQLTTDFPKSRVAKRLVLEHASGAEFEARITPYLHTGLTKGAPPLYTSLASLFAVPAKAGIIQRIVEQFHADLTQAPPAASTSELPCTLVWAKYFLARLYDDQGKHAAALEMLNSAIQHTPTLLELYTAKAKVYKHAGCPEGAAFWQNHARELDTADKYLGSKAAKYALLNGDLKHADYIMGLFCRAVRGCFNFAVSFLGYWPKLCSFFCFLFARSPSSRMRTCSACNVPGIILLLHEPTLLAVNSARPSFGPGLSSTRRSCSITRTSTISSRTWLNAATYAPLLDSWPLRTLCKSTDTTAKRASLRLRRICVRTTLRSLPPPKLRLNWPSSRQRRARSLRPRRRRKQPLRTQTRRLRPVRILTLIVCCLSTRLPFHPLASPYRLLCIHQGRQEAGLGPAQGRVQEQVRCSSLGQDTQASRRCEKVPEALADILFGVHRNAPARVRVGLPKGQAGVDASIPQACQHGQPTRRQVASQFCEVLEILGDQIRDPDGTSQDGPAERIECCSGIGRHSQRREL